MFQGLLWQILWRQHSFYADESLSWLMSRFFSNLFKGHEIPFNAAAALCQVTWNFSAKKHLCPLRSLCVCAHRYPRRPGGILSDGAPAFCLCDALWMLRAIAGAVFQAQMMKSIELLSSMDFIIWSLSSRSMWMTFSSNVSHIKQEWFCTTYVCILVWF